MSHSDTQNNNITNEIDLVDEVKACTDCQWFWGAVPPYGPFPAFDWDDMYPQAIKDGPEASDKETVYWTKVKQVQGPRVEPAVLRGCRKAPIMTIGINPNMTAFFAGSKATTWAYPYFQHEQTYAYYYRHATIYQESFDLDDLKKQVIPGSEIFAEYDGSVTVSRSDTHRWLSIEFVYDIDGEKKRVKQEHSWFPDERLVVFARDVSLNESLIVAKDSVTSDGLSARIDVRGHDIAQIIATDNTDNHHAANADPRLRMTGIKKGDLIAANIQAQHVDEIALFANKTGYYDRASPILDQLSTYLRGQGFEHCDLAIGEDISMHDMVGCASPGWGDRYKIPTQWISEKCVDQNRYMLDQLIQSKPRVVLIVSTSSLLMFAPSFMRMGGTIDLDYRDKSVFDLLKETCCKRLMLHWSDGGQHFSSRLIVTPHFSYDNNFKQQSRFKKPLWDYFVSEYQDDYRQLIDYHRVDEKDNVVFVDSQGDPLQEYISADAWELLMMVHYNPYALIQSALIDEHKHDALIVDKNAEHLARAPGDCTFCVNERWQFPEGCDYGLAKAI